MAECRSCHAPAVWMKTEPREGKPARPILVEGAEASDEEVRPQAFPDGNLALTGRLVPGRYGKVQEVRYVPPGEGVYRAHFTSCPNRDQHRRR